MPEFIDLLFIDIKCHIYIGLVIQVQRILHQYCRNDVITLPDMEIIFQMRMQRPVHMLAMNQLHILYKHY